MTDVLDLSETVFVNNSRETFTPTVSGAIGTCIWELCRAAAAADQYPWVITNRAPVDAYPWRHAKFVEPVVVPTGRRLQALKAVRRVTGFARVGQYTYARRAMLQLRALKPKVIVCSNDPEIAVYLHEKFPEARIVHWFHNVEYCSDAWRRRYVRAARIESVAVSSYLAHAVARAYDIASSEVRVALNGVDIERFHPSMQTGQQAPTRLPTIGFVGRIAVEKAPDLLLRACLKLADAGLQFRVQIIGDTIFGGSAAGPYRTQFRELCAQLAGTGIAVHAPGHLDREQVAEALRDTDIHVVPSRWDEPCGLTVLEGLATGIPVVVSAAGGMPELVPGNDTLFARDDVAGLAVILARLIAEQDTRTRLGIQARERAVELTWAATLSALFAN